MSGNQVYSNNSYNLPEVNRRQFLKTAALTAGGLAVPSWVLGSDKPKRKLTEQEKNITKKLEKEFNVYLRMEGGTNGSDIIQTFENQETRIGVPKIDGETMYLIAEQMGHKDWKGMYNYFKENINRPLIIPYDAAREVVSELYKISSFWNDRVANVFTTPSNSKFVSHYINGDWNAAEDLEGGPISDGSPNQYRAAGENCSLKKYPGSDVDMGFALSVYDKKDVRSRDLGFTSRLDAIVATHKNPNPDSDDPKNRKTLATNLRDEEVERYLTRLNLLAKGQQLGDYVNGLPDCKAWDMPNFEEYLTKDIAPETLFHLIHESALDVQGPLAQGRWVNLPLVTTYGVLTDGEVSKGPGDRFKQYEKQVATNKELVKLVLQLNPR